MFRNGQFHRRTSCCLGQPKDRVAVCVICVFLSFFGGEGYLIDVQAFDGGTRFNGWMLKRVVCAKATPLRI